MKKERSKKINNGGFSLIELLAAITILAAIFIPLMHSFVTATRTNTKAKRAMEATTAGQNVFEELKANTVADFMADAVNSGQTNTGKLDSEGNAIYTQWGEVDRTVNGISFRVKVTLDPQDYTTQTPPVGVVSPAATDYNSAGWSQLSSLSKPDNAFLILQADDASKAADELALQMPGTAKQDILDGLERRIDLSISHGAVSGVSIVKASVTYTYNSVSFLSMDQQEIYNNGTELTNELKNLFICFYPMYNNSGRTSPTETITVDNTLSNYPVGVYVIRQASNPSAVQESRYSVGLDIKEAPRNLAEVDADGNKVYVTKVATNLAYTDNNYTNNELQLTYNGVSYLAGYRLSEVLDISEAGSGGLARVDYDVRIYKATIEIYEQKAGGGYELLTTMEGTKIE
ncbi:MAG: prepilin-type N-terminal cleavage/methylation domain-containing protein [Muribaculaceae bacterium]|nr:prepilin-type N-terminal cleavage/methylation domain-containing protein [Roseburia sp.]MCM1430494.1 prepilin-type N-terminal cleavage/methylation domain-containing protein [Muribaculaceae bacterium]MCM1493167.1 prepilin-type N-terminal cleavage/methylation domain-containing protein [Muribaculaceae bacterium]